MTPEEAFAAIRPAIDISIDVAAVTCIMQMKESGYGKEQVDGLMDEALGMIGKAMPDTYRTITDRCHLLAQAEAGGETGLDRDGVLKSMAATAYGQFAYVGFSVAERLVRRKAKGGAA